MAMDTDIGSSTVLHNNYDNSINNLVSSSNNNNNAMSYNNNNNIHHQQQHSDHVNNNNSNMNNLMQQQLQQQQQLHDITQSYKQTVPTQLQTSSQQPQRQQFTQPLSSPQSLLSRQPTDLSLQPKQVSSSNEFSHIPMLLPSPQQSTHTIQNTIQGPLIQTQSAPVSNNNTPQQVYQNLYNNQQQHNNNNANLTNTQVLQQYLAYQQALQALQQQQHQQQSQQPQYTENTTNNTTMPTMPNINQSNIPHIQSHRSDPTATRSITNVNTNDHNRNNNNTSNAYLQPSNQQPIQSPLINQSRNISINHNSNNNNALDNNNNNDVTQRLYSYTTPYTQFYIPSQQLYNTNQSLQRGALQSYPYNNSVNVSPAQQYNQLLQHYQTPYVAQQHNQQQQHTGSPNATNNDSYKAVIECGIINRQTGQRVLTMYEPYFDKEVEIYTAVGDSLQRPLYRASLLSDKFNCASNKLCMYLSRRRSASDGVYQSISFTEKPTGHTGLKQGNYFVTMQACLAFQAHYEKQQHRKLLKDNDELLQLKQQNDINNDNNNNNTVVKDENNQTDNNNTNNSNSNRYVKSEYTPNNSITTTNNNNVMISSPSIPYNPLQQQQQLLSMSPSMTYNTLNTNNMHNMLNNPSAQPQQQQHDNTSSSTVVNTPATVHALQSSYNDPLSSTADNDNNVFAANDQSDNNLQHKKRRLDNDNTATAPSTTDAVNDQW